MAGPVVKEKRRRQDQDYRGSDAGAAVLAEGRGEGGGGGREKRSRKSLDPILDAEREVVCAGESASVASKEGDGGGGGEETDVSVRVWSTPAEIPGGTPEEEKDNIGQRHAATEQQQHPAAEVALREPMVVSPSPGAKAERSERMGLLSWPVRVPSRQELRQLTAGTEVEERRTLAALRDLEACLVEGGVAAAGGKSDGIAASAGFGALEVSSLLDPTMMTDL